MIRISGDSALEIADMLFKPLSRKEKTSEMEGYTCAYGKIFSKDGEDFRAEVTVHPAKNIVLKGTGVAADPYSAFDNANEHIATRLRRQKTKLNDHKGKTGIVEMAHESVFPLTETEDEMSIDESAPLTIAETDANIKVCTVSEAVMYMDLADENALMFRNSANNRISMVYRRKDGNIGWVEPAE